MAGAAYLLYRHWDDVAAFFENVWRRIEEAFDIGALLDRLASIDLAEVGRGWIVGLAGGVRAAWGELIDWITGAVGGLLGLLPGAGLAKDLLGIDIDKLGKLAAPAAVPSAIAPAQARNTLDVRVGFEDAPANMRVKSVKSDSPDVGIDVTAGYAMAP